MGGGKGGSTTTVSERELTQQELDLLETQKYSLDRATAVAEEQFNLSKEDREYFEDVFRNPDKMDSATIQSRVDSIISKANIDDDKKAELKGLVTDSLSSGMGVDEILFETVKASSPIAKTQLDSWYETTAQLGKDYISQTSGLSKSFADKLQTTSDEIASGSYEFQSQAGRLQTIGQEMGTADGDIYARTKGQELAGISQAYAEAQKQLQSNMAQRGITDSGVDIQATTNLSQAEAMQKAQGFSRAYTGAIQQSDLRRQQQAQLIGQETGLTQAQMGASQLQSQLYGQQYQTGLGQAQLGYGVTSGLETSNLQNQLNLGQQNLANLQMASGASQGVYQGSANYLGNAGNTANQSASVAGSTASNLNMKTTQTQTGGGSSLLGSVAGGVLGSFSGALGTNLASGIKFG
jgi:hypothetical protein